MSKGIASNHHETGGEADFEQMLVDPSAHYAAPRDVVRDSRLSVEEKIHLLMRWEADARALAAAEVENMAGGEPNLLDNVLQALGSLGAGPNPANPHHSAISPSYSGERRQRLERRIFEYLMEFPERIDEMETRSERACRALARRIAELFDEESHEEGQERNTNAAERR